MATETTAVEPQKLTPIDYMPVKMRITSITQETSDIKTFRLGFCDEAEGESFEFRPGQFGLYSVFGAGEATFCIASSPTRKGYIECSVKRAGKVTGELHDCEVGDVIGFRGPYGSWFPVDEMKGGNLLFIGGGIGLAPLRSLIWNCLDWRDQFADVTILYGARSVGDLVYKAELNAWRPCLRNSEQAQHQWRLAARPICGTPHGRRGLRVHAGRGLCATRRGGR